MQNNEIRVPDWLKIGEDQLKEIEARNKIFREEAKLKENLGDKDFQLISYAKREESLARANIQAFHIKEDVDKLREERRRLVEALLTQGKFKEAIQEAEDTDQIIKAHSLKYGMILEDTDRCSCSDNSMMVDDKRKPLSRHYVEMTIYSPQHGRVVPVFVCSKCGHTNLTENFTPSFNAINNARLENHDPDNIPNDGDILRKL